MTILWVTAIVFLLMVKADGRHHDLRCTEPSPSPSHPNMFGHGSLQEASAGLDQVWYITECSRSASLLLCSAFFPPAAGIPVTTNELCLQVQTDCKLALEHWPTILSCDQFRSKSSNQLIDPHQTGGLSRQRRATDCSVTSSPSLCRAANLTHNAQLFTMISFGPIANCTQPCRGVYFSDEQLTFLHYWTIVWSSVCLASCFIALVVYIICWRYIKHPEAPIFYIALCYIGICLAYLLSKLTDRNDLLCDNRFNNSRVEYALVSNMFDKPLCTMVFGAHYYFTLATWSWWLILTVEWLGVSITDKYISWKWQILSHLLGWGLPISFLSAAVATRAATGNSLLQMCWFSPQQNEGRDLLVFFILPLTAVILCCSLLLLSGFLINSCNLTQRQHRNQSTRTVPLLALSRTSTFSTLFLVVNGLVLSCNLYELFLHSEWENYYLQTILHTLNEDCQEPLPTMGSRPAFPVILTLVASSIATGVVLLLWLPRRELLCCCGRQTAAVMELSSINERPKHSITTSLTEQYSNDSISSL